MTYLDASTREAWEDFVHEKWEQNEIDKSREMLQTETERVRVSVCSGSGFFDVGQAVPTCPALHCQEITTPSPRSPADCKEKPFV